MCSRLCVLFADGRLPVVCFSHQACMAYLEEEGAELAAALALDDDDDDEYDDGMSDDSE